MADKLKVEGWGLSFEYENEDSAQEGLVHKRIDEFLDKQKETETEFINGNMVVHYRGGFLQVLDRKGRRQRFGITPSHMQFERVRLLLDLTGQKPVHWVVHL